MLTRPHVQDWDAELAASVRSPEVVCAPERLGAAYGTRHSFTAALFRQATRRRWQVTIEQWHLDPAGCGTAIYRVDADGYCYRFVAESQVINEDERSDRVTAQRWDVAAALVTGPLDELRLTRLRHEVTRQEYGRADPETLVWTRGNRSSRYFSYVVDALARGTQPDPQRLGTSAYVLRSTAFYANGRFGMAPFAALTGTPLAVPYRAQMLTAWLFREFSCDLVEHIAAARSGQAAALSVAWRRYMGIGNATGLGMVPFIVNHPAILDAWCRARELPLAHARATPRAVAQHQQPQFVNALSTAQRYLRRRKNTPSGPFPDPQDVADELAALHARATAPLRHAAPWEELWCWAEQNVGIEAQEALLSLLTDLDDACDDVVERQLTVDDRNASTPADLTAGALRQLVEGQYRWALDLARRPTVRTRFWYYAQDSEEPRRGTRGSDPGADMAMAVGVPGDVADLRRDLADTPAAQPLAWFLARHPEHRGTVERIWTTSRLPYGEVHDNLEDDEFLPLRLQRFQLATYGAENFLPQSTDWLRVTLLQGAPSRRELPWLTDFHYPLLTDPEGKTNR